MKKLLVLEVLVGALAGAKPASAHSSFSLSIGVPGFFGFFAPAPCPPAVVYAPPPVVYERPAYFYRPIYYVPPPRPIFVRHHRWWKHHDDDDD